MLLQLIVAENVRSLLPPPSSITPGHLLAVYFVLLIRPFPEPSILMESKSTKGGV